MKKLSGLVFTLLFTLSSFSQTVIENPQHGLSSNTGLKIIRIELQDSSVAMWFRSSLTPGSSMSIPGQTYIVPSGSSKKLFIRSSEGILIGKNIKVPASGLMEYKLIFPGIDAGVSSIDYGEEEGSWHIYDIRLKDVSSASLIPGELRGNWFNTQNGEWEISFLDSVVVYKKNVWKYAGVEFKNREGSISVKLNNTKLELPVSLNKDGNLILRASSNSVILGRDQVAIRRLLRDNGELFTEPVFKYDSVVFSGYLSGYSPKIGVKTGIAYVNNILTSAQDNILINISDNGYFSVKMPFYYPHDIFLRSDLIDGSIYLVPGRDLFVMIDPEQDNPLFMGDDALLNTDLQELNKINALNYQDLQEKILQMSPLEYKKYILDRKDNEHRVLDSIRNKKPLSAKSLQLKKISIDTRYSYVLMDYKIMYEGAYRTTHNIPSAQRELPVKTEIAGEGFYDFITNELTNNPLSLLSNDYFYYINRLKYNDLTRIQTSVYSIVELLQALVNAGVMLTEDEKTMKADLDMNFIPEADQEFTSYIQKYSRQYIEFRTKYSQLFTEMTGEQLQNASAVGKYLADHGVELTDGEKEMLIAKSAFDNSEGIKKNQELMGKYTKLISNFYSVHSGDISLARNRKAGEVRKERIENTFGVHRGLATDIMDAQDECRRIVVEKSPLSAERLQTVLKSFRTPFIAWYIEKCNNEAVLRLAAEKKEPPSPGIRLSSVAAETPKTKADVLFETMMSKYKGKVVYVDFWATWCGPCRSENERIKPVKEALAGKDIVFVYITNPTSPKDTYDNMITGIGGEHYRLTTDEWNYLSGKFNISGIPHTVLVDKDGKVIDSHLMQQGNSILLARLQKLINK